jgi:4-alpha-glucanotransferase
MLLTPEKKIAGVLAPLFALRREGDLGIGDVGALREFIDWAADHGFGLVQLLPANETGNDHSPYNAISSIALDPVSLEISPLAVPDLTAADLEEILADVDLTALRAGPVAYPLVKTIKRRLLDRAFANFRFTPDDTRLENFYDFCKREAAWLEDYALFRVLMDEHGTECWDTWPEEVRTAEKARAWLHGQAHGVRGGLELAIRAAKYRQWIAAAQWRAIKAHATRRHVALMGDIPFGVSYYSADTWARPDLFDLEWCGGCPPEKILEVDAFTKKWGQNWGIPLYRWPAHREEDFAWWRRRVRKVRGIFHLFRIDHVLGVFRIYSFPWRPQRNADFLPLTEEEAAERTGKRLPHFTPHDDDTPAHMTANHAQGAEILRVLLAECGAYRLVGEDLGVVPPYVRPCLHELGIAGFKVPQWECEHDGRLLAGAAYQRVSLATYATHDHDPLRAMWETWMAAIATAEHGGPETHAARDKAWRECRALAAWCGFEVPACTPWSEAIHDHLLRALFATNSWLAVLMITDVFATTQRFNIPGAVSEANWSQRLLGTPADWRADPALSAQAQRVAALIHASGRGVSAG